MSVRTDYAVITPARNEATRLPRLAASLAAQTVRPERWLILENGSSDDTFRVAMEIARTAGFVEVLRMREPEMPPDRGAPVVRAFEAGIQHLGKAHPTIMKVDADVTLASDYAQRTLEAFAQDTRLGIASGACYEERGGEWRRRSITSEIVWCAARAYRQVCLEQLLPLEKRLGWDTIDIAKARVNGWKTRLIAGIPFRHFRLEGERDGADGAAWENTGRSCYFLGYRPSYVLLRAIGRAREDRQALRIVSGYVKEFLGRGAQYGDARVRRNIREYQRLRYLFRRIEELNEADSGIDWTR